MQREPQDYVFAFPNSTRPCYSSLVESPRIRGFKSLNVYNDVILAENNCPHKYNINANLKTTLLFYSLSYPWSSLMAVPVKIANHFSF